MSKSVLRSVAAALLVLGTCAGGRARAEERSPCEGGIIDKMAVSKPAPAYPKRAREARVSGTAYVQVRVNAEGFVTGARFCAGPPLLRAAALKAARRARFLPLTLAGRPPVSFVGVLTYRFEPPKRKGR